MKRGFFVVFVGILISLAGLGGFYSQDIGSAVLMSGNVAKEKVTGFYEASSIDNRITILLQIVLVIFVLSLIFFIIKSVHKKKTLSKQNFVKGDPRKSRTDLDTLYEILKQKKEIAIDEIERVFKIGPDVALGWAKILENGDIAVIDYPRFGKPVLRLVEEEEVALVEEKNVGEETHNSVPSKKGTAPSVPLKGKVPSSSGKKLKEVKNIVVKKVEKKVVRKSTSPKKKIKSKASSKKKVKKKKGKR